MDIQILGRGGPRSNKGKAISSMNAVKHGAYAKTRILPHESEDEYKRIVRELIKSFKPRYPVEKQQVYEMANTLWSVERHRLKLMYRQEAIFKELTPRQLAEMVGAYEPFWEHAPEWLKQPNTKFSAKELKLIKDPWRDYLHLIRNSQGIKNYNVVFVTYQKLFESMHPYLKENHGLTLIMSHGKALELQWQQNPKSLE
jgi:hypothetical protein